MTVSMPTALMLARKFSLTCCAVSAARYPLPASHTGAAWLPPGASGDATRQMAIAAIHMVRGKSRIGALSSSFKLERRRGGCGERQICIALGAILWLRHRAQERD